MANKTHNSGKLSLKKKLIYNLLIVTISIFFLIAIELLLRAFSYGNNMHLIIKHPNKNYKEYYSINPFIGEKYFSKFDATGATNDIFLKQKPQNGFRLFVMGSSSLVGFPYDKNLMATRILHKRLQDAYPDKEIEIVNTAITAISSITLSDYMNEIVKYSPDAILIYAGHNEFYGAFGVGSNETMSKSKTIRNLHFKFMNWRIYQMIRSGYTQIGYLLSKEPNTADSKGSLMKRIVADQDIPYKGEKYQMGMEQYRSNFSDILTKAKKYNIPIFISDLVSNVKDVPPMGNNTEAYNAYNNAIEKLKLNDTIAAKELFYRAKDLDPVRFRASEEINVMIDSLAKVYNCYFISTKAAFEEVSDCGIIGSDLITEHVHPNIKGQFVMADAFYTGLVNSKLISSETSPYNLRTYDYYQPNWGYTALDSMIGEFTVKQLKSYWPFVPLTNTVTFRDTYKPKSVIDSLAFSVLLSSKPKVGELHEFMATQFLSENNYEKALKEYESLIQINPYGANYYNQAVNCLLKLDDLHAAENYLNKSLKYKKTYFACLMLAEIKMIKHNFGAATLLYESAIDLAENENEKNDVLKKLYLAYHYNKTPDKQEVVRVKLDKLNIVVDEPAPSIAFSYSNYIPYNVKDLILKADKKIQLSELDSALFYLGKSVLINDTPVANKLIGDILFNKKNNNLLYYYIKAYDSYSQEPAFLKNYCIANLVNSKFAEAKEVLNTIKALDPGYPDIAMLEKLLKGK